ncbi:hypothetical protein GCM10011512_25830 [Tersicoccus solisilvae]|uniref:DUF305 domain-containing protein n=1 Tax=Tersicoccus solisilvae TaxID=1882339 RepID=A0ABQ1PI34_9MICC|nr:DUF305 domain-containing protein [Tersicoccus solisilvae]GGC97703.1 hypothetical protein GCM10011512_25830 [Tersicoccus solisilvae]
MNIKTLALPAALLTGALLLAGCGTNQASNNAPAASSSMGSMDHGAMSGMSSSSPSSSPSQGTFNDADVMFTQMMLPHHEQAVQMSDMLLAKQGIDPRIQKLAQQIKAAQAPEISTMRGWLSSWGQPSAMASNSGHSMDGMMSGDDMAKLKAADGAAASKLFLTQMIAHHEGAVSMAKTEVADGKNADAVAMAKSVVTSQTKEIDEMKAILAQM